MKVGTVVQAPGGEACIGQRDRFVCTEMAKKGIVRGKNVLGAIVDYYCDHCFGVVTEKVSNDTGLVCECGSKDDVQFVMDKNMCVQCRIKAYSSNGSGIQTDDEIEELEDDGIPAEVELDEEPEVESVDRD